MAEALTLHCCTCVKRQAGTHAVFWIVTAPSWAWPPGADGQQLTAVEESWVFHKTEVSNSKLTPTCPKGIMCKYKVQTTGMEESYTCLLQALRMNPTRKERRKTNTKLLWEPETPSTEPVLGFDDLWGPWTIHRCQDWTRQFTQRAVVNSSPCRAD